MIRLLDGGLGLARSRRWGWLTGAEPVPGRVEPVPGRL